MKKFFKLILAVVILILSTGCGNSEQINFNDSGEEVSKEMLERMSNGEYDNIDELLGENIFISSKAFENYLDTYNLDINGNQNIEYLKDKSDENEHHYSIDDEKIIKINTININGKWYVDLALHDLTPVKIEVPTGAEVTLDGINISNLKKETNILGNVTIGDVLYDTNVDKYEIDFYFESEYSLEVKVDEIGNFSDEIGIKNSSYSDFIQKIYSVNEENIVIDDELNLFKVFVFINEEKKNEIIKSYTEFYTNYLKNINDKKIFNEISSEFNNNLDEYEKNYVEELSNIYDGNPNYKDFSLINYETRNIYYLGDNKYWINILLDITYTRIHKISFFESVSDSNRTKNHSIVLTQNDENYLIYQGNISVLN